MFLLYTIGFFLSYDDDSSSGELLIEDDQGNQVRLFQASEWVYPARARLSGDDPVVVRDVGQELEAIIPLNYSLSFANSSNSSNGSFNEFSQDCQDVLQGQVGVSPVYSAYDELCIYLGTQNGTNTVHLLYPGREEATPFSPPLSGAQYAVYQALWKTATSTDIRFTNDHNNTNANATTTNASFVPILRNIQRTPELLQADERAKQTNVALLLAPGILQCMAAAVMVMFIIGPPHTEQTSGVVRSFVLVGVKLRTYMLTWWIYYAGNGLLTAAALTLVSIFYNLMPQSDWLLIFFSHYLSILGLVAVYIFLSQVIPQEELAQGLPWLGAFGSMAVTVPCLLLADDVHFAVLYVATVISPFCGIMHYYAVYATYDYTGVDTGIHFGDGTVQESGLLGVYIAQLVCVLLWLGSILVFSSPHVRSMLNQKRQQQQQQHEDEDDNHENSTEIKDNFEPLAPGSDVLLQVRGLHHTFAPGCGKSLCNKSAKSTDVLKGLDLVSTVHI